jgi:predicted secreted Zn-dependent protease
MPVRVNETGFELEFRVTHRPKPSTCSLLSTLRYRAPRFNLPYTYPSVSRDTPYQHEKRKNNLRKPQWCDSFEQR